MGRIALFVVVIGGAIYVLIEWIVTRILHAEVNQIVAISIAVLAAVALWTALIWRFGDRLGGAMDDNGSGKGAR